MVGCHKQNRKGSYTPLDILPSNRNLVGPVADWMSSVDLFLRMRGQQHGNMEEAASVAQNTCYLSGGVVW